MDWVLARGGDGVRTGLEDNIRVTKDRLAKSNAELVQIAVEAIGRSMAADPQRRRRRGQRYTSDPLPEQPSVQSAKETDDETGSRASSGTRTLGRKDR